MKRGVSQHRSKPVYRLDWYLQLDPTAVHYHHHTEILPSRLRADRHMRFKMREIKRVGKTDRVC